MFYIQVCSYEVEYGGVVLDSSGSEQPGVNFHFPVNHLHTLSPTFLEIVRKKAHLVIRMLENRLGKELLLQVEKAMWIVCQKLRSVP